jgi:hypothetical protein
MEMPEMQAIQSDRLILVVSYDDKSRVVLTASPVAFGMQALPCASFGEAEKYALSERCSGLLVELSTMVKAQGEEKAISQTLSGLYPTLRVKTMGPMIVPMAMGGDAKQDKSLKSFFSKSCAEFTPRSL